MKQWLAVAAILGATGVGMAAQMGEPGGDYGNDADANWAMDAETNGSMDPNGSATDEVETQTLTYDTDWSAGPELLTLLERRRTSGTQPFIVQRSGSVVSLKGFGAAPWPAIPGEWRQVHQVAAVAPVSGLRQYDVIFLSPHYAMVGAHPARRVGGAVCMRIDGEVRLYALGGEAFAGEAQMHRDYLDASTRTIRGLVMCTAARETAPGEVSILEYGEDGLRHEPMEGTTITIEALPSIAALRPAPAE